MGAHVSKIKHLKLDQWEDAQVTLSSMATAVIAQVLAISSDPIASGFLYLLNLYRTGILMG